MTTPRSKMKSALQRLDASSGSSELGSDEWESEGDSSELPLAAQIRVRAAMAEDDSTSGSSSLDQPKKPVAAPVRTQAAAAAAAAAAEETDEGESELETEEGEESQASVEPSTPTPKAATASAPAPAAAPHKAEASEASEPLSASEDESEALSEEETSLSSDDKQPDTNRGMLSPLARPLDTAAIKRVESPRKEVEESFEYSDDTPHASGSLPVSRRSTTPTAHLGKVNAPSAPKMTPLPREIRRATQCPIEVDIEDMVAICRCGQSDKFPFCDSSHVAYNAEHSTAIEPWLAEADVLGSTIMVCGCAKSVRRSDAGIPLCDHSCKVNDVPPAAVRAGPPPATAAVKPPKKDTEPPAKVAVSLSPRQPRGASEAPRAAAAPSATDSARPPPPTTPAPQPVAAEPRSPTPTTAVPRSVGGPTGGSPRAPENPSPRAITVVDRLGDVTTGEGESSDEAEQEEEEEDTSVSLVPEDDEPPAPFTREIVRVLSPGRPQPAPQPAPRPASKSVAQVEDSSEEDSEAERVHAQAMKAQEARLAAKTREKQLADEALAAQQRILGAAATAQRQREQEEKEAEAAAAARKEQESARRRRDEEAAAAAEKDKAGQRAAALERERSAAAAAAAAAAEAEVRLRAEREAEAARRQREEERAVEEIRSQRQREKDDKRDVEERSYRRRRVADDVASDGGESESAERALVVAGSGGGGGGRWNRSRRELEELFDSSEEPIYLPWEDGARSLARAPASGFDELYCTHWDPASCSVRYLVAAKGVPVRVTVGPPPGGVVGGERIEVLPILVTAHGRLIKGGADVLDYLVDRYRESAPVMVSKQPQNRSRAAVISNICQIYLLPLLYLYPSHTLVALAGKPPVPMRSAAKEQVFKDHLAQLDVVEQYASRSGPFLVGKTISTPDVMLFPLFVFYTTYFHRLRKMLWTGRPKLKAWWDHMGSDATMGSIEADMHTAIAAKINSDAAAKPASAKK